MGRECSVCEFMGVKAMTLAAGLIMGQPDESEYAVDPVGVLTIKPSQ